MYWCQQQLEQIGHPTQPLASEFLSHGQQIIPQWFRHFVYITRAQAVSMHPPFLDVAPRPFVNEKEVARVDLLHEIGFHQEWQE